MYAILNISCFVCKHLNRHIQQKTLQKVLIRKVLNSREVNFSSCKHRVFHHFSIFQKSRECCCLFMGSTSGSKKAISMTKIAVIVVAYNAWCLRVTNCLTTAMTQCVERPPRMQQASGSNTTIDQQVGTQQDQLHCRFYNFQMRKYFEIDLRLMHH